MKAKLSHRWRIALIAAAAAGVLFALVLFGALAGMSRSELGAAEELLNSPLNRAVAAVDAGERGQDLDEAIGAHEGTSVVIFGPGALRLYGSGALPLGMWTGAGMKHVGGRDIVFKSAATGPNLVVAASDWTESGNHLSSLALLFGLLLLPLSATVGFAAFSAAGLMYRPLKKLTGQARTMASAGRVGRLENPDDADFSPLALELNALLERIESEVRRQERLVSDVAHDLRTPLTVIRGRLETALLRGEAREYKAAMEIAIRESERLSLMADAILRSEVMLAEASPSELSLLLREAVERWKLAFQARDGQLTAECEPCQARILPGEWSSLLDNLLDNALKYGGATCTVRLTAEREVLLVVADDGPGVPESERETIFERFVRLDNSRGSEGHGLGLFLCAQVVRARGGQIRMESNDPSGAKVIVNLPRFQPHAKAT